MVKPPVPDRDQNPQRLMNEAANASGSPFPAIRMLILLLMLGASSTVLNWQHAGSFCNSTAHAAMRQNGFELDGALVPAEQILKGGVNRDEIAALSMPDVIDAEELAEINFDLERGRHGSFLRPDQRVVGVLINGEARAYGVNLLTVHEIVNDVVGGVPLAVVYCPLCDSVVVFDRRVEGEILEFGVSGLLYNSNVLMYNRTDDEEESLWSQLQARAVTGPHAARGSSLQILPAQLLDWAGWLDRHPQTGLAYQSTEVTGQDYSQNPYDSYFEEAKLMFPAWPMLPKNSPLHQMNRIIAVDNGDGWMVFPVKDLQRVLTENNWVELEDVVFSLGPAPPGSDLKQIAVDPVAGSTVRIAYSFWFSWYAMHPDSEIFPILD